MNTRMPIRHHVISGAALLTVITMLTGCSSLSPEAQESLGDIRGSLPKFMRGDAVPLEEQPMPSIAGKWVDNDFPELVLKMNQSGDTLRINRDGTRQGIVIVEQINATLKGRAIKAKFINNSPKQIRPTSGKCVGAVTKDSQTIRLTCTYKGNTFPLNFSKAD